MRKSLLSISLAALAAMLPSGMVSAQTSARVLAHDIPAARPAVASPLTNDATAKRTAALPRRADESNILWQNGFDSQDDFDKFTVINANNDDVTWSWGGRRFAYQYAARTGYSSTNGNDDWLVTPAIHLTSDGVYNLTFKAKNQWAANPNTIEVKYGSAATVEGLTQTIMETATPGGDYAIYTFSVTPSADGDYYFGFHDNTAQANMGRLILDSIVVAKAASLNSPDSVTGLKVTPADKGALSATLSFAAPTKNIDGSALTGVDSLQVERDGVRIGALPQAAAGAQLTYTDSIVPTPGVHAYSVIPYAGGASGLKASAEAYIGQDVPTRAYNVRLVADGSNVRVTWNRFSTVGRNGGYVDPDSVKLIFYKLIDVSTGYSTYTQVGDSIAASEPGATTALLPQNPEEVATAGAVQELYSVGVRAVNIVGQNDVYPSGSIVIGPSLPLPFAESFSQGRSDNGFAWTSRNSQANSRTDSAPWNYAIGLSSDDDSHCAIWMSTDSRTILKGDAASINMAKVKLTGVTHPALTYNLYATASDSATFEVHVLKPNGTEDTLQTINLAANEVEGWTAHVVDLSAYASESYVIVRFWGYSTGSNTRLGLDDIQIYDQRPYDLKVTGFTIPPRSTVGKTPQVAVSYQNIGQNPASGYSVVLYADGQPVDTATVADTLAVMASGTATLSLPIAVNKQYAANGFVAVQASVNWSLDGNTDNNSTAVDTVKVAASSYQRVTTLAASADGSGNVALNWTAPAKAEPITETEDFEGYLPWATELGDWKLVDNSKGTGGYLFFNYSYPLEEKAFAYCAFNPNAMSTTRVVTDVWPGLKAHSGNQYAAAPNKYSNYEKVNSDEWLISPELSGKSQTISFFALNWVSTMVNFNEKFDVLYSTKGNDPADFTLIESDVADGTAHSDSTANWKEFNVALPEGAKYFAIHHNSTADNVFLFGVDDITYTRLTPGANDSIIGYNLYRDSVKIASANSLTLQAADKLADGTYTYNVTVLYQSPEGEVSESAFSNDATVTVTTGIDRIAANSEGKYNVFTFDGKLVLRNASTLRGLTPGLYIINGSKYVVR